MGNPYDFREVMKAAFGFTEQTVEEVLAEQKRRHDQENRNSGRRKAAAPTVTAKPKQSEIDKLNALLSQAKPTPPPTAE